MNATIIFSAQITIEGENIQEIKRKWENMELFSDEAEKHNIDYRETIAIEDDDFNDITDVWEGKEENEEDDD